MGTQGRIRLGTRGSRLALQQSEWVRGRIADMHPEVSIELIRIKTTGDKLTDVPLAQIGGKGAFVKEIEEALLRGEIDLAVHSMKDVPTDLPEGLHIGAICTREDPRDALISRCGKGLRGLPPGTRIGTSSLRRRAQLLARGCAWEIVPLRGNLDTRIRRVEEGKVDAIVVAAAGLRRMGFEGMATEILSTSDLLPAVGQGAIGVECCKDSWVNELIASLEDEATSMAIRGERAFLRRLGGGCQVPIAAYAEVREGRIHLQGMVARLDGSEMFRAEADGCDPEEVGVRLAEEILAEGGGEILKEIYGA